ncbi:hypothetical protein PHAVU_001G239100 [Phaseolus vulgaris]|uniref:Uncharacterized protein n=1 Tax=Phaseolus vulgaris TaxID=3885 RepID=V7CZD7_PHAVU|nr:hypothetical protein PHAVU_001G239100g [Phaseolus vulgaris]ESW35489.1 hypothetical protein PHAVU_001G239100g [Phaseolus vulgaris]
MGWWPSAGLSLKLKLKPTHFLSHNHNTPTIQKKKGFGYSTATGGGIQRDRIDPKSNLSYSLFPLTVFGIMLSLWISPLVAYITTPTPCFLLHNSFCKSIFFSFPISILSFNPLTLFSIGTQSYTVSKNTSFTALIQSMYSFYKREPPDPILQVESSVPC